MRLLVTIEHHFFRDPQGRVFPAPPAIIDHNFWKRYLDVFPELTVLARVRKGGDAETPASRSDGPGVTFFDLPDYLGPWAYLRSIPALRRCAREAAGSFDAFIFRVPGSVGGLVWREVRRQGKPFALEVVGDPWDALSPGTATSLARPVARRFWARDMRRMCQEAVAVSYVTREALQERYPSRDGAYTTHASSIELTDGIASLSQIEARLRRQSDHSLSGNLGGQRIRIGFVGVFHQLYKGPDVLLKAVSLCRNKFPNLELVLVGDGRFLEPMRQLAQKLGMGSRAQFRGSLPSGEPIFKFLDGVDLFVLPSRTEGLPRALIEAMARGCPCIGTTVGGVPELLPAEDLVPVEKAPALANKISEFLSDPNRMARSTKRNWETSKEYSLDVVGPRRTAFYEKVRELVENSQSRGSERSSGNVISQ